MTNNSELSMVVSAFSITADLLDSTKSVPSDYTEVFAFVLNELKQADQKDAGPALKSVEMN